MLHMIALILKILGIVLAVILGIIVLLVCVILFVPVRYEAQAKFPGELKNAEAKVRFSWLLHLIAGEAVYRESEFKWKVRTAWFKFDGEEEQPVENVKEETKAVIAGQSEKVAERVETAETQCKPEPPEPEESKVDNTKPGKEALDHTAKKEQSQTEEKVSIFQKLKSKLRSIWEKIKCTFVLIRDKIISVSEVKDRILAFLTDEIHKAAFLKAKKEIKWILRFLKPKKFSVKLHYGFEDPYTTGQVLAVLSMIYPFVGDNMSVQPDFEHKVMEGDAYLKGKLRMIYPAVYFIKLILNKNVRLTFKDVKNFKLK